MYHHATFCPLSRLRFFVVWAVLLVGVVKMGYGQRVYADAQQNTATPLLASVSNAGNATLNNNSDTSLYSTLNVTLGLVGLVSAQQNLQFVNVVKPTANTPVIVKFGTPGSILELLGGFSVQRTNNNNNTLVAPSYGGVGLLELLNLFGGGSVAMLKIPPTGAVFDGVRLTVNTTLGVARTSSYYYAFYITPPQLTNNEVFRCEEETGEAIINNFQAGYTYRLYTTETGGTEIPEAATTTAALTLPSNLEGTYWLEARENDIYPSARTEINITVVPQPGHPQLSISDVP